MPWVTPQARPEHGSESETIPGSEERAIRDGSRESPQRPMFAAERIVRKIHRSQHIQRVAGDADQREGVPVVYHREADH